MAMDATDKRLVNGLIYLTVICALAYYIPGYGYADLKKVEGESRNKLEQKSISYNRYYAPIHPAHFGGNFASDPPVLPSGAYMSELKEQYSKSSEEIQKLIDLKEQASRMQFPDWTVVPTNERDPGVYFQQMWQRKRNLLNTKWNEASVFCLDDDIGFSKYSGKVNLSRNEAEELLRKLCIAEKIIELCIAAKLREETDEKGRGLQSEAYVKIISVEPAPSMATGPSALIPNPKYSPEEKNPTSERFRKYNVRLWKSFIQEYPVQIKLQCDVNSFMRFLHSVRQTGQFLVIRNLEIVSPFFQESQEDKSEFNLFNPDADKKEKEKVDLSKKLSLRDEHILVRISAAGMDFFDPAVHPRGLYDNSKAVKPTVVKKPKFKIDE